MSVSHTPFCYLTASTVESPGPPAPSGVGPNNAMYWQAYTIPADEVSSNLTNFPVLLTEANMPSAMFDADGSTPAQPNGGDLRATDADFNEIPLEVVEITTDNDPANGTAVVWVRIPSVSSSEDTYFYLWWGNTTQPLIFPAVDATNGRNAVWNQVYKHVWHIPQRDAADNTNIVDSAGTGKDLNGSSNPTFDSDLGPHGKAAINHFAGGRGHGNNDLSLDAFDATDVTFEIWLNPSDTTTDRQVPYIIYNLADFAQAYLQFDGTSFPEDYTEIIESHGAGTNALQYPNLTANNWYHIAHEISANGAGSALFVDAVAQSINVEDSTDPLQDPDPTTFDRMTVGQRIAVPGGGQTDDFIGYSCEYRLRNDSNLGTAWYQAGIKTMTQTDTFAVLSGDGGTFEAASGDAYFSSVSSLLLFNGSDGGTTFTQEVAGGPTFSAEATDAQLDTARVKYGTASLLLDGNDYLTSTGTSESAVAFGTDDFTIEFWIYYTDAGKFQLLYDQRVSLATETQVTIYTDTLHRLFYFVRGDAEISSGDTGAAMNIDAWNHVALCRSAGVTRLFIDGTQVGNDYNDTWDFTGGQIRLGDYGDGATTHPVASYDDFRITKGIGRYVVNFTPPAAELPTS